MSILFLVPYFAFSRIENNKGKKKRKCLCFPPEGKECFGPSLWPTSQQNKRTCMLETTPLVFSPTTAHHAKLFSSQTSYYHTHKDVPSLHSHFFSSVCPFCHATRAELHFTPARPVTGPNACCEAAVDTHKYSNPVVPSSEQGSGPELCSHHAMQVAPHIRAYGTSRYPVHSTAWGSGLPYQ